MCECFKLNFFIRFTSVFNKKEKKILKSRSNGKFLSEANQKGYSLKDFFLNLLLRVSECIKKQFRKRNVWAKKKCNQKYNIPSEESKGQNVCEWEREKSSIVAVGNTNIKTVRVRRLLALATAVK